MAGRCARPSGKRLGPSDAEHVLAGRLPVGAGELIALIRAVNPTDRGLGTREADARYATKARLQSLLVRRFAGELEAVGEPGGDGVVLLRLRAGERSACHAVVAALDEDARAWTQLQLDLVAQEERRSAPAERPRREEASRRSGREPAEGMGPEALARRAQEALEAFDYEHARELLERAVAESGGAVPQIAALLSLLVEVLGDDAAALALRGSLSRVALSDSSVRTLLALAAARSGDEPRALELVQNEGGPRSAEVFAALASVALRHGDLGRAAGHLAQAQQRGLAAPAAAPVQAELERARAARRGPEEAELLRAAESSLDEETARRAGELLARWPESEVARRVLRALDERKRRHEARRLVAAAEEALAGGDLSLALGRLRQAFGATEHGPARDDIARRLAEVEAAERARVAADDVERVCALLDAPGTADGLLAYLDLDEELRGRVRARRESDALRWLDRIAAGRGNHRSRVQAVLALERARSLAAAEPAAALELIEPHDGALGGLSEARHLAHEARGRLRDQRIARARELLRAGRAALDAGDAAEAARVLEDACLRELPEGERAEAAALQTRAVRTVGRQRLVHRLEELRAADRLFEARAAVAELLALAAPEEQDTWLRERAALTAQIQRMFCVEVDSTPKAATELRDHDMPLLGDEAYPWICSDGRSVVLAQSDSRWISVRIFDLATGAIRTTVVLRSPEPLENIELAVRGSTLWALGAQGALLEIDMERWEVLSFRAASEISSPGEIVDQVMLAPSADGDEARYLWLVARSPSTTERVKVIDLDRRRVVREIADVFSVISVPGPGEPRIACLKGNTFILYGARGTPLAHGRVALHAFPRGAVAHPSGRGVVVLLGDSDSAPGWAAPLELFEISPEGIARAVYTLDDADAEQPSSLVTDLAAGLLFVLFSGASGERSLCAFCAEHGTLAPLYRVPVGTATTLLGDGAASVAWALSLYDGGVDAVALGATPPELPVRSAVERVRSAGVFDLYGCGEPSGTREAAVRPMLGTLSGMSPSQLTSWLEERQKTNGGDPRELVEAVYALPRSSAPQNGTAARLLAWLCSAYPENAEVRLLQASKLAREGRWGDVVEALASVDAAALDAVSAQHLHHLLLVASARLGNADGAKNALCDALAIEGGGCNLTAHIAHLGSLPDTLASIDGSATRPPLHQLLGAIAAADACLAAGDAAGAIRALDRRLVWVSKDVQSLGRLAEAYLRDEAARREDRMRAVIALARFCEAVQETSPALRRETLVPGATWSAARLDEIAARARRWLDEHTATGHRC
jgi:hypothetical protein